MPKTAEFVPALHMVAGGWTELNKPGLNGFLSVIDALHWWGSKIEARAAQYGLWNAAVADVCWVMEQLIESWCINDSNPQTRTKKCASAKVEVPSIAKHRISSSRITPHIS
ncbi:hypothetical protein BKA82DRAFT_4016120 [Pisolithus tinctorius]|nr:hypothetical protein BKA82DRAFT_4016120 [Pisolithus tinctorius]